MSSSHEAPAGQNPDYTGPAIEININGDNVALTWENTALRTFLTGDGAYDHIEYTMPDGQFVGVLMDFEWAENLKVLLKENSYPFRVDPVVDARTAEWYAALKTASLETDWQDFAPPPDISS